MHVFCFQLSDEFKVTSACLLFLNFVIAILLFTISAFNTFGPLDTQAYKTDQFLIAVFNEQDLTKLKFRCLLKYLF